MQLDYPPRTKLSHWAFLLQSSLPLCNSCHPLNLPMCLSSTLLGAPFCLFQSEGISFSQGESHRPPPALIHSRRRQLGFGPSATTSCCFAWGSVIHPGAWGVASGTLFVLPGCRIERPEKQQKHHVVYLCIRSTNVFDARPWGGHGEKSHIQQTRSRCTLELRGSQEDGQLTASPQLQPRTGITWGSLKKIKINIDAWVSSSEIAI